ncbi:MAG TPA: site-specific DNA-methyltransferase [Pyrinomonadaceae bacterium]|nr:site-specific DNA-methyltransferase [Pyrinomonadaceae bacterium]
MDPPYNTGNEGWIYNDNVNDEKIKKWLGQVVGKEGEDLSRHDKWLCMMYPRLKMLHKLLADDGAIFISIDDIEVGNLRLILDEIFGVRNFIANVIWQKKYSPQNDAQFFSAMHDHILVYAKSVDKWKRNLLPRTEKQDKAYKNLDNDLRGNWKSSDLTRNEHRDRDFYGIQTPSGKIVFPAKGRSWSRPKDEIERLRADNRLWFGNKGDAIPSLKRFLSEVKEGIVPSTIWFRDDVGDNQDAKQEVKAINSSEIFDTPKPTKLLKRILELSTKKDSIILDSFAGSGTTAHAVVKLNKEDGGNRKFILIETMDYAETITAERVRRVMQGYGEGAKAVEGLGGAFDYYEIGDRIFLEDDNLNEAIGVDEIRRYVAFSENIPVEHQVSMDNELSPYLLGLVDETAYFFIYEPQKTTTLDLDFLANLPFKPKSSIIYADNCLLTREFLQKHNIIFKKIPREITRF